MKQIVIDTPCTVPWNGMKKTEAGRFCSVCNKEVRDYSNKSAAEIAGMIEELSVQKPCARFNVEHVVMLQPESSAPATRRFLSVALLAILMFFGCKTKKKTVYTAPRYLDFNAGGHQTEQTKIPNRPHQASNSTTH